jgi:hypothetical protein
MLVADALKIDVGVSCPKEGVGKALGNSRRGPCDYRVRESLTHLRRREGHFRPVAEPRRSPVASLEEEVPRGV